MTIREEAPWLEIAWGELGVAERTGPDSEPRVVGYYRDAGRGTVDDDSVPWCAAFVGAALKRAGFATPGSLLARSYARFGAALDQPRLGAIAVFSRGSDPAAGHVGFIVGWSAKTLHLLGGNQGDAVTVASFDRARLLALRWPTADRTGDHPQADRPATGTGTDAGTDADIASPAPTDDRFETGLDHVLRMEGGYTDDPHDPGGATNFGITIGTLAAWRGIELTAGTHSALNADLRAIDPDTVRQIYRARYWQPSRAAEMPAPLGLMHFDASVNHGLAGAARMLQAVLGVTVDGEIGPLTLAAAREGPIAEIIERYADERRRRYRALPHFLRFGRGWLARVDRTLARARAFDPSLSVPRQPTSETPMTTLPRPTMPDAGLPAPKWWGQSITIWGALITAAATVVPAVAPVFGINLTPDVVRQIGGEVVQATQATLGVIGTILTIYGRLRASTRLESRSMTVRL